MTALPVTLRTRWHQWTTPGTAGSSCPRVMTHRGKSCRYCPDWRGVCCHRLSPVRDMEPLKTLIGRMSA